MAGSQIKLGPVSYGKNSEASDLLPAGSDYNTRNDAKLNAKHTGD